MNKSLATLLATTAAAFSIGAYAQSADAPAPGTPGTTTTTTTVTTDTIETRMVPAPGVTRSEAKDLKTESKGDYKARKNIAEANHDLNKADCKVNSEGAVERACKADARAQERKEKADAKLIHKTETQDINAVTK
ncbi:MAG: hypothetical protein M3N82_10910 [Pseudomonadota bacterium]|nr:hypothetical protein [Pseudomonadota bacterium]